MKIALTTWPILFSLLIVACDSSPVEALSVSAEKSTLNEREVEVDLTQVRAFFDEMGADEVVFDLDSTDLSIEERQIVQWTLTSIGEWPPGNMGFLELRFKKARGGDDSAHTINRHKKKGLVALVDDRYYIQLFAVHLVSDPEFHGVIEIQGPTLISFFGEGA